MRSIVPCGLSNNLVSKIAFPILDHIAPSTQTCALTQPPWEMEPGVDHLTSLAPELLRATLELLDVADLAGASGTATPARQIARPLFFILLKREFPLFAEEESSKCDNDDAINTPSLRERALELGARRRLPLERKLRGIADAITAGGIVAPPPRPPFDVGDLSLFLRIRHKSPTSPEWEWEGTLPEPLSIGRSLNDLPVKWYVNTTDLSLVIPEGDGVQYTLGVNTRSLTPETMAYPEFWGAVNSRNFEDGQWLQITQWLRITALLIRQSDGKVAQLAGDAAPDPGEINPSNEDGALLHHLLFIPSNLRTENEDGAGHDVPCCLNLITRTEGYVEGHPEVAGGSSISSLEFGFRCQSFQGCGATKGEAPDDDIERMLHGLKWE